MVKAFFSAALILIILLVAESLKKQKTLKGENARKFVHILVGCFVATWPFYMEWGTIQLMSLALLVVVFVSREFNIFKAVHGVKRRSHGELFFALGIGVVAFMEPGNWVFAVAMLHVALADGVAAVIGEASGKKNRYRIFGQPKSVAGTLSYWIISTLILAIVFVAKGLDYGGLAVPVILGMPPLLALIENISGYGLDNLTVPVFLTVVLSRLAALV